ncbi:MAG TPA: acetylxylan esterase [Kiritimatiellia bacterium]|nr:acetylxylan esterase [Kiritimatiellia bacterium]
MQRSGMRLAWAGWVVVAAGTLAADDAAIRRELTSPVLDGRVCGGEPRLMLDHVLSERLAQAGASIRAAQERIAAPEQLAAWQRRTRAACLEALGGFPERSPLNPRVTGTIMKNGYRVEKILFESRPSFYMTALLFLPDAARFTPPYPGVIIACGHSNDGKGMPGYQRGAVLAAANGIAALIYDPIDQGERLQGSAKGGNCAGHNTTGVSAALLGWNTATFRIWDGIRALDYLASRPEVDAGRLGCMGNSGGGTLTTYIAALDDRVVAASPSCYISSLEQVCGKLGPQDAEQNLFGQMAFGLDHSGWLLLRAPKATCVCAAQKDMFPIQGTYQTRDEVEAVYMRLGAADRFSLAEYDGPHAWAEPLKISAVRWMSRWLRQKEEIVIPPESETGLTAEEGRVSEAGQVMKLAGARSVYDIMRDESVRLARLRGNVDAVTLRNSVRRLAGIRALSAIPVPISVNRSQTPFAGGTVRRVALTQAGRTAVSAVFFQPADPQGAPVLVVDGLGKTNAISTVSSLVREGCPVLAVDVCGFGETHGSAHKFYGAENGDEGAAMTAFLLGQSLVGLRAEDVLLCARWLSVACGSPKVDLRAANWAVTPALHAAAAEPQLFARVSVSDAPLAWEDVVAQGDRHRFSDLVHGALREYTIGDLKRAAAELK